MGRPRKYANDREKWRANKHDQRHPTQRHVLAPQEPGRYFWNLTALLQAGERFGTIYADPPWPYDDDPPKGNAKKHYALISLEALCALPVRDLAADNAHLHLWVTNAFLFESRQLFDAWGFTYRTNLVWCKPQGIGTGHYWRNAHEILLLGVRGHLTARTRLLPSWIQTARDIHSAKPERVRDLVEQLSPGPYLELFGRPAVPGWTVFGNEQIPTTGRLFKDRIG
jgi:N6-adenosine-specific RNA methylase IME4